MSSRHIDVRHVASLSRLELTDEEVAKFQPQLEAILAHADALAQVDISGIETDESSCPTIDHMRNDVPQESLPAASVVGNAPDSAQDQVRVPKVIADV